MNTLLLRLSGPMQSWGTQSRFTIRDTGLEPSKSGVLGLICAAMGIPRHDMDALRSLTVLRMGVRVDREGKLRRDYHVAQNILKAGGGLKNTEPSHRYYLADAIFLVGLEGENLELLKKVHSALQRPVWGLFLGRKAFVPGEDIYLQDGLRQGQTLKHALTTYPCLNHRHPPEKLRLVLEDLNGSIVRSDQPLCFIQGERKFAPRRLVIDFTPPIFAAEVT